MKKLCFILLIGAITFSCKKKEPEPTTIDETSIDVNDPNQVAGSIKIRNSTVKDGTPPPPSQDPASPKITDLYDGDNIQTTKGATIDLGMGLESGEVTGYYMQVEGASTYFDISAQEARVDNISRDLSFQLELPANISLGKFCISYRAYDSQGRVSNYFRQCIEIRDSVESTTPDPSPNPNPNPQEPDCDDLSQTNSQLNLDGVCDLLSRIWGPGSNSMYIGGGLNYTTQAGYGWAQQYDGKNVTAFSITGGDTTNYISITAEVDVSVYGPEGSFIEVWDLESLTVIQSDTSGPNYPVVFRAQPNRRYGGFAWYMDNHELEFPMSAY
ncbi:MAG: hypothetical protein ACK4ND_17080 [Cytophagaceae bacterium]